MEVVECVHLLLRRADFFLQAFKLALNALGVGFEFESLLALVRDLFGCLLDHSSALTNVFIRCFHRLTQLLEEAFRRQACPCSASLLDSVTLDSVHTEALRVFQRTLHAMCQFIEPHELSMNVFRRRLGRQECFHVHLRLHRDEVQIGLKLLSDDIKLAVELSHDRLQCLDGGCDRRFLSSDRIELLALSHEDRNRDILGAACCVDNPQGTSANLCRKVLE